MTTPTPIPELHGNAMEGYDPTPTPIRYVVIDGTVCDVNATGFDDSVVPLYVAAKHYDALKRDLAAAQEKALLYDLDKAGIEMRTKDAVELVQLRADFAAAQERIRELETKLTVDSLETVRAAQEEIRVLRMFGNKDCTAQADEYLATHPKDAP